MGKIVDVVAQIILIDYWEGDDDDDVCNGHF